jgi:aspartyl-tRNA(Asn)/glutamyl-tRNA(Gln) amidotransferase subunit B
MNYEIKRQGEAMDEGKAITQETRLWNQNRDRTEVMRSKENSDDYRFFPEPDIPVFVPDEKFRKEVEDAICELPLARFKRFKDEYGLSDEQADALVEERPLADYFEAAAKGCVKNGLDKKKAASVLANRILVDVKHILTDKKLDASSLSTFNLTPARLAALTSMVEKGELSGKNARQAIDIIIEENKDAEDVVKAKGWKLLSAPGDVLPFVKEALAKEAATVADYKAAKDAGNKKRLGQLEAFLTGKVIAASHGRAAPAVAKELLLKEL